jgi:hypothetical protein
MSSINERQYEKNTCNLTFAVLPVDIVTGHVIPNEADVLILENGIRGVRNNSGYYVFLNLNTPNVMNMNKATGCNLAIQIPQNDYLTSKTFIDFDHFNLNDSNTSTGRAVISYLSQKEHLLEKLYPGKDPLPPEERSYHIANRTVYPSNVTILQVFVNRIIKQDNNESEHRGADPHPYTERPVNGLTLYLQAYRYVDEEGKEELPPIMPDSAGPDIPGNLYVFSLDAHDHPNPETPIDPLLGKRDLVKFHESDNKGMFDIIMEGISTVTIPNNVVEKNTTTVLNIHIIG